MKKLAILTFLIYLMVFLSGCAEVGPQEGGVRTTYVGFTKGLGEKEWFKQGIKTLPLKPGLYLHIPHVTEVEKYPVKDMQYHMFKEVPTGREDVFLKTKDGQKMWIDVSIRYRLTFEKLSKLHRDYGDTYIANVLRPTIRSLVNNKLGEYSAEKIYDGLTRQRVAQEITQLVNTGYDNQVGTKIIGLEIVEVLFRRFEFSDEYQNAIEQKRIASEQHLAAIEWAKKKEAEARGEKLAIIQRAEGDAERVRQEAEAELFANLKEAEGIEAIGRARAESQRALADALGGGELVVRLEFAKKLAESFQVWGIPVGENTNQFIDVSGVFGNIFPEASKALKASP